MKIEETKGIAKNFIEAHSAGRSSALRELISPDFILHVSDWPHPLDSNQYLVATEMAILAFSGLTFSVEDIVAEGEKVAVRMTVRGTHTGVYQGISPTGRRIEYAATSILHVAAGKVDEEWQTSDQFTLLKQIGRIPSTVMRR